MAIDEVLLNFPNYLVGRLLSLIIFPFGPAYSHPSDKLISKIVASMTVPSEFRDRLTRYCYVSHKDDELTARLDKALIMIPTVEPLQKLVHKAVQNNVIPG